MNILGKKRKFLRFITSKIFILFLFGIFFINNTAFAVWDGNFYDPGETYNPECLPSDVNCDVSPAVATELDPVFSGSSWFTTTNNSATGTLHTVGETTQDFMILWEQQVV